MCDNCFGIEVRCTFENHVVVRVLADDGKPVEDAKLRVHNPSLTLRPASIWAPKHLGDGRYEVPLVGGLDYDVAVSGRGFAHTTPVKRVSPKAGQRLDAGTLTLVRWSQRHVPDLLRILANPDQREVAARLLGEIGPGAASAVPALIEVLKDHPARNAAARALGQIGPGAASAVPALIELLKDHSAQHAAVYALGRIGPSAREAVPELIRILREDFAGPRAGAAEALGLIGDPRALPSLRDALTDKTRFLAKRAAEVIRRIEQSRTRPATTQPTGKGAE